MAFVFLSLCLVGKARNEANSRFEKTSVFRPKIFSGLVLRLNQDIALKLQQEDELPEKVLEIREKVFDIWGIMVPGLQFDVVSTLSKFLSPVASSW